MDASPSIGTQRLLDQVLENHGQLRRLEREHARTLAKARRVEALLDEVKAAPATETDLSPAEEKEALRKQYWSLERERERVQLESHEMETGLSGALSWYRAMGPRIADHCANLADHAEDGSEALAEIDAILGLIDEIETLL